MPVVERSRILALIFCLRPWLLVLLVTSGHGYLVYYFIEQVYVIFLLLQPLRLIAVGIISIQIICRVLINLFGLFRWFDVRKEANLLRHSR